MNVKVSDIGTHIVMAKLTLQWQQKVYMFLCLRDYSYNFVSVGLRNKVINQERNHKYQENIAGIRN